MNETGSGALFVISGASGAGKSTVINALFKKRDDLKFSVSVTTRPARAGEVDGRDYHFVDRERFEKMIEEGALLEHVEYVGNFYGTPLEPIRQHVKCGDNVVLELEVNGACAVKRLIPEAVTIFITPSSVKELECRLRTRATEDDAVIKDRIQTALSEYGVMRDYDYIVINDQVENAVAEILTIMSAEGMRTCRRLKKIACSKQDESEE